MSSSQRFNFDDQERFKSSVSVHPTGIDWNLCVICQEDNAEQLTRPSQSKRTDVGSGYTSLAENLEKFSQLGQLPQSLKIVRMDEGVGIEAAMVVHNALYHKKCQLKFNNTKLKRAEKRTLESDGHCQDKDGVGTCKYLRSQFSEKCAQEDLCFFCSQAAGEEGFRAASTFQLDSRVRACAEILEDTHLLARLSVGDVVALEAKYHAKCLVGLYNRARKAKAAESTETARERELSTIVFAELVLYIEETRLGATAPVFKLVNIARRYTASLEQVGVKVDGRLNTTRLKERLLSQFPDMSAHRKGRDVLLAFNEDICSAIAKSCDLDSAGDAVCLARAAQVVRRQMFQEAKPFIGFAEGSQESVPQLLLGLVRMVLDGASINEHVTHTTPAALSIAQLIKFNSVKHNRTPGTTSPVNIRHSSSQETPFPTYLRLMVHAHTRKRELVDKLSHFGISISYDRVLRISAHMGDNVCQQFQQSK